MNTQNNKNMVTIHDLKTLGNLGGATALLDSGEEVILSRNYGLIRREAVVSGKLQKVDIVERYKSIYSKIRTIKWNGILVARKVLKKGKPTLELTGRGYRRDNKIKK